MENEIHCQSQPISDEGVNVSLKVSPLQQKWNGKLGQSTKPEHGLYV